MADHKADEKAGIQRANARKVDDGSVKREKHGGRVQEEENGAQHELGPLQALHRIPSVKDAL